MLGLLVGVGFALVPEQRAEAVGSELVDTAKHAVEKLTRGFPFVGTDGGDEARHGGLDLHAIAFREPLPDAGRAVADAGDRDRDAVAGV